MRIPNAIAIVIAAVLATAQAAPGIVVRETDSPIDTSQGDPNHAPHLENVGFLSAEMRRSAVYVGQGLVLTTHHGYRGRANDQVWFLGKPYDFDPKRTTRMRNPSGTGLVETCDLVLIRLTLQPPLPALKLAERAPFGGERVVLAGYGMVRAGGRLLLDASPGYATRIPEWSAPDLATWGENIVEAGGLSYQTFSPDGDVLAFAMIFNDSEALALEAHAAAGDSGGAVFVERGSGWELAGIIEGVGPGALEPGKWSPEGAPFGAATYAVDLTVYREQILAPVAVPEPGVAILLAGAPIWLLRRRRAA